MWTQDPKALNFFAQWNLFHYFLPTMVLSSHSPPEILRSAVKFSLTKCMIFIFAKKLA